MPPSERARDAAVRLPESVRVNVTASPDWRGVEWFCGDTEWMKGLRALRAVYSEDGIERGSVAKNGARIEGVDSWRELQS